MPAGSDRSICFGDDLTVDSDAMAPGVDELPLVRGSKPEIVDEVAAARNKAPDRVEAWPVPGEA